MSLMQFIVFFFYNVAACKKDAVGGSRVSAFHWPHSLSEDPVSHMTDPKQFKMYSNFAIYKCKDFGQSKVNMFYCIDSFV